MGNSIPPGIPSSQDPPSPEVADLKLIHPGTYYLSGFITPSPGAQALRIKYEYDLSTGSARSGILKSIAPINEPGKCLSASTYTLQGETLVILKPSDCTGADDQKFIISTDGKIYNYGLKAYIIPNVISGKITTASISAKVWRVSELLPRSGTQGPSLWNETLTYPVGGEDGKTLMTVMDSNKWFSNKVGDYSIGGCGNGVMCSLEEVNIFRQSGCPDRMSSVYYDTECGSKLELRKCTYCAWTGWETSLKEACIRGEVIDAAALKIDAKKCKLYYSATVFGKGDTLKAASAGATIGAWAPWTAESATSQSVMDFCTQHDTFYNTSFLDSPTYSQTCGLWGAKNAELAAKARRIYCTKYPGNSNCVAYCGMPGTDEADNCLNKIGTYCKGEKLLEPVCQTYCNSRGNCDTPLNEYCRSLPISEAIGEKNRDICGCHLSVKYYADFFASLEASVIFPKGSPSLPQCYYPYCAASNSIKPAGFKDACPAVVTCISNVKVDLSGNVDVKEIRIDGGSVDCSGFEKKKEPVEPCLTKGQARIAGICTPCVGKTVPSSTNDSCIPCIATSIPSPDHSVCRDCTDGRISNETGTECVYPKACPPGQARIAGVCSVCPGKSIANPGGTTCTDCTGNKVPDTSHTVCNPCVEGKVVNKEGTQCVNHDDPTAETFWEKYKWYIIGGIIALVVLIIVIIIIAVVVAKHKRKLREMKEVESPA